MKSSWGRNSRTSAPGYLKEQIDQMCEKTDTEMPRITLSEIDYR